MRQAPKRKCAQHGARRTELRARASLRSALRHVVFLGIHVRDTREPNPNTMITPIVIVNARSSKARTPKQTRRARARAPRTLTRNPNTKTSSASARFSIYDHHPNSNKTLSSASTSSSDPTCNPSSEQTSSSASASSSGGAPAATHICDARRLRCPSPTRRRHPSRRRHPEN